MNILILTSLFPPDIGDPAPYVKELISRLAEENDISLLTYGYLPESVFATVHTIDKRLPVSVRLFLYTKKLFTLCKQQDLVFANNGPSTDTPLLLAHLLTGTKYIYCISDQLSYQRGGRIQSLVKNLMEKRALKVIRLPASNLYRKPEMLPFTKKPNLKPWETWWQTHLSEIKNV